MLHLHHGNHIAADRRKRWGISKIDQQILFIVNASDYSIMQYMKTDRGPHNL